MDGLDLLKKDWFRRGAEHPKLSYQQIHSMLFKKSTSIVKWIFLISIGELLFWLGMSLLSPQSTYDLLEKLDVLRYTFYINFVHYTIVVVFIYLFYKNYTKIRVTDTAKKLMQSILKTRKTVRYFVIYNVVWFVLMLIALNLLYVFKSDILLEFFAEEHGSSVYREGFFIGFMVIQIIFSIVIVGLLILFYRLIYGILLKRLHKNYNELKKIEV